MSHPHEQHGQPMPQDAHDAARSGFGGPRLELPRFQFAPRTPQPPPVQAPATHAQPQPTHPAHQQPAHHRPAHHQSVHHQPAHSPPSHQQPAHYQPVHQPSHHHGAPVHHHGTPAHRAAAPATTAAPMLAPTVRPPVHGGAAHAPTWGASPTGYHVPAAVSVAVASTPAAVPARPAPTPAARAMASTATRPVSVSWDHVDTPAERGLLQRITPVHMGVLMVMVMVMMVVTSGPAAMTATPARLPALTADGGGSVPMPVRAGTTATAAATPPSATSPKAAPNATDARSPKAVPNATDSPSAPKAAAPAPASSTEAGTHHARPAGARTAAPAAPARPATPRARMLKVGSGSVRARVRAGGIPSPAAAANLAVAGGGRVRAADTGSVRMAGIPSPAASEQLGPQTLPFRPTDGVTLPRATGERDSHAVDTHYAPAKLAMEEPALPAMTPGAAAAQAERQVTINQLSGSAPAPVSGGLAMAY